MDVEQRIEVAAPPANVWAVMTDVERWPEWTPTVTSIERLDGGPLGVGSRVRIRQPRLPVATWTVTAPEPDWYFEWQSEAPGVRSVAGHRIELAGAGASRIALTLAWSGWLAPALRLFYGRLARRYVRTEPESLKRRCERGR
ncbi:MAG: SRPBCC family protein [Gemmatimonadaceae bacterium]